MNARDARIDAYIAKARPFAQPILTRLRVIVHKACPEVEETIKWGVPHFDYRGMMAMMAAFKAHCVFGVWHGAALLGGPRKNAQAMGDFGRITTLEDLPPDRTVQSLVRRAMRLNEAGIKRRARRPKAAPRPLRVPRDLATALAANRKAAATFAEFPPGEKREYVGWITEAKIAPTRERRLVTAVEWMAEGRSRNWKYKR